MADDEPSDDELVALGLDDPSYTYESPEDFHNFMRWLLAHGAPLDELAAAVASGIVHVHSLRNELAYLGPSNLSAEELAERVHVPVETLNEWWLLLRLPWLTRDGKRFTEADVALARGVRDLARTLPDAEAADALRSFGAGMQQMAHGLQDAWSVGFQAPLEHTVTSAEYSEMMVGIGENVRRTWPAFLFGLFWRHMCVAVVDDAVAIGENAAAETQVTIVFVDLVDFTRLSQRVDFTELATILGAFEQFVLQIAQEFGGRLVKLLGDGAMFQFVNPDRALEAARASVAGRPELPPRRAGLATGRVVQRQADFFGPAVNLAARLASVAAPGELVVDVEPADIPSEQMDPVVLKGYDEPVTPFRVKAP